MSIRFRLGSFRGGVNLKSLQEGICEFLRYRGTIKIVLRTNRGRQSDEQDSDVHRPKLRGEFQATQPLRDVVGRRRKTATIAGKIIRRASHIRPTSYSKQQADGDGKQTNVWNRKMPALLASGQAR
jgi:hypothetical protein